MDLCSEFLNKTLCENKVITQNDADFVLHFNVFWKTMQTLYCTLTFFGSEFNFVPNQNIAENECNFVPNQNIAENEWRLGIALGSVFYTQNDADFVLHFNVFLEVNLTLCQTRILLKTNADSVFRLEVYFNSETFEF